MFKRRISSLQMILNKHQLHLLEQHNEHFKFSRVFFRINTEGKIFYNEIKPCPNICVMLFVTCSFLLKDRRPIQTNMSYRNILHRCVLDYDLNLE